MTLYLNTSGQVGPAIVFFFLFLAAGLTMMLLTPVVDEIENAQVDQVANGMYVSEERIETMNTLNQLWTYLPFVCAMMIGLWYWITSLRESGGAV